MASAGGEYRKPSTTGYVPRSTKANYSEDVVAAEQFLKQDKYDEETGFYFSQLKQICLGEGKVLTIRLDDMLGSASSLGDKIRGNTFRYMQVFEQAADLVIKAYREEFNLSSSNQDSIDVLLQQRMSEQARLASELGMEEGEAVASGEFPPELTRRFEVCFVPSKPVYSRADNSKAQSLRDVKSSQIGKLVTIQGIVTRVGEVLPRIVVACYLCDTCGFEVYQPVTGREFTPLTDCPSPKCRPTTQAQRGAQPHLQHGRTGLHLREKYSQFVKFQEVKIQELPDQVPIGNCPRSLMVECRGETTRACTAGDVVNVVGIFLPEKPRTNRFRPGASGGSLISSTYLRCMSITKEKRLELNLLANEGDLDELIRSERALGHSMYDRLAKSIAPEIYGHLDVKKAILLQLVGGVDNCTEDGMKIRGDINIALVGDPGVAKSQLLKHVALIAPRAVYTTGKGSSGVGLTAAVTRDSFTGQVALEAGALVLADKGVCCIDEFDKMDESDRSSIHEVMEQQTVSIAKAGITTTLNARTAVLAAANPLFGRYNKKVSPQQNINLPASLLSRFDLLFLLLDKASLERDRSLAEHVTYVHMHNRHPKVEHDAIPPKLIRAYIASCRKLKPLVPHFDDNTDGDDDDEARSRGRQFLTHIVEAYVAMRQQDVQDCNNDHAKAALTPRHLLSILRLASAHARLRQAVELDQTDVDEAIRLVRSSKSSMEDDEDALDVLEMRERDDPTTRIYRLVCELLKSKTTGEVPNPQLRFTEVEDRVLRMGFSTTQLKRALEEYSREDVGVLHVTENMAQIRFLQVN
ncbi:hypothetical protein BASA81_001155 [Batrachochytrium salamandrivorans]|nr:hypothetical protein BASA81_001155 [Batrachochytrium salamandrivorans]